MSREMLTGDNTLVGTWRLISWVMEDVATGERKSAWGEQPDDL